MNSDFSIQSLELFSELTTRIGILPTFKDDEMYLLTGNTSEFKPKHETTVPLWLALMLKKQQKCKIMPPFWMK